MLCLAQSAPSLPPERIRLPRSSTRLAFPYAYVKLVTSLREQSWGAIAYEGRIYRPGAMMDTDSLPSPAVVIELAGPIGIWQRGKHRELLYILWRLDMPRWEWVEVARAQSLNWGWSVDLREAVFRTLHPRPELVDIIQRSRDVADELMELFDVRLQRELREVRASVLHSVYERVAGKLVDCA
jgi:hypothetical protein